MANKTIVYQLIVCGAVCYLILSGKCCTPGNRDAIERLKKYLGVEPVLDELYHTDQHITRAQELNCDFENPRLCLWKNNELGSADQLEWYLMHKVEDKTWPRLVRPGDSPPSGNHFILAGTQTFDPEAKAVWISSPILCQRSEGRFMFTYWIFGKVAIEAVPVLANVRPLTPLPDIEAVTCLPRALRNEPCILTLPPISEPFQIAIKLYSEGRKEGFGAIDNILYEADVCAPEIGSFSNIPLGLMPNPPTFGRTSSDANCNFDGQCHWYNVKDDDFDWSIVTGEVNPSMWQQATKSKTMPEGGFAMIPSQKMSNTGNGELLSLPFYCQRGDGALSFSYWKSGNVLSEVCVVTLAEKLPHSCRSVSAEDPRRFFTIPIPGPIVKPYQIMIRGKSIKAGRNNFIVLDNMQYKADVCDESHAHTEFTQLCQAISCNFRIGTICKWILNTGGMSGSPFALYNHPIGVANNVLVSPSVIGEHFVGTVIKDPNQPVSVMQSSDFKHAKPLMMMLALKRSTWGSEVYICFDDYFPSLDDCELLAGPSLSIEEATNVKRVFTGIPAGTEKVFVVAKHASLSVSGPAAFGIEKIDLVDANRHSLCT